MTSMSSEPKPAMWSRDTGQRILEYGLYVARRRHRAHAPATVPLVMLTIEKELHGGLFLCMDVVLFL